MAILIKNPEVERKARELAARTGKTLTAAIDSALTERLLREPVPPRPRRSIEEMIAATDRFRKAVGLDKRKVDTSKARFDEINEIPGLEGLD